MDRKLRGLMKTVARTFFFLFVAMGAATSVSARELPDADRTTLGESAQLAASFARCAGYWTWLSESTRRDGKPAGADYLNTYANGAYSSALWLLATRYAAENAEGPPRTYGSFGALIEGPRELERLRMTALEESGDIESISAAHTICEALTEGSETILSEMRQAR